MKAVILAAGQGKRLGRLSHHRPKCLLNLGPTTIIEHQIANLRLHDITNITVVVGYRAAQVQHWLGDSVHYIYNPDYATTNSLYSLWLACRQAEDGFVLLNGDVVFHPQILGKLLACPYPDALTIDRKSEFDDEQMKVALDGDRVVAISKELDPGVAAGENLGVVKFSRSGARVLFETIEGLIARGRVNEWCPYAFDAMAPYHPIYGSDIGDLPWIEIDFPADLMKAVRSIYPKIVKSLWAEVDDSSDLRYAQATVCPRLVHQVAGIIRQEEDRPIYPLASVDGLGEKRLIQVRLQGLQ